MQFDAQGVLLVVAVFFTLIGAGIWLQLILNRDIWRRRLEEGRIWLEWRPLPPGLGLSVMLALLAGWAVMRIFFLPLLGGIPASDIPATLLQSLSITTFHLPATLAAFWWISTCRIPVGEALGLHKPLDFSAWRLGVKGYFFSLPAMFLAGVVTLGIYRGLGREPEPQLALESLASVRHPAEIALMFLLIALVGPFCEEVMFRGLLFPALTRRLGTGWALVLHSLLFSAIHLHPPGLLPLFVLSVILGLSYQWSRNLMSAFVFHAVFNAATLVSYFWNAPGGGS